MAYATLPDNYMKNRTKVFPDNRMRRFRRIVLDNELILFLLLLILLFLLGKPFAPFPFSKIIAREHALFRPFAEFVLFLTTMLPAALFLFIPLTIYQNVYARYLFRCCKKRGQPGIPAKQTLALLYLTKEEYFFAFWPCALAVLFLSFVFVLFLPNTLFWYAYAVFGGCACVCFSYAYFWFELKKIPDKKILIKEENFKRMLYTEKPFSEEP